MDKKQQVAIVTGASAGIGRAYALALAAEGMTVIAAARRVDPAPGADPNNCLSAVARQGQELAGNIVPHPCDVTLEQDIINLVAQTVARFGRIDVLVNNAADLSQYEALSINGNDWDNMMITNVRAPYVAIREVAGYMKKQRSGSIINITAGAGNFAPNSNYPGMLPYAVSKAALNRLSGYMSAELKAHGIAVNSLSPGVVLSEAALRSNPDVAKAGTHKPATAATLGPALIFLASQTGDGITGEILHTDEFGKSWP